MKEIKYYIADIKSVGGLIARAGLTMRGRKLSDEKWFILYSRIKGFNRHFVASQ